ncbi:MAG TPA: P63C domain-containing protein [Terriglobales bacterium]
MASEKQGELYRSQAARALSSLGASKGGKARAKALTPEQRQAIGRNAVEARWRKAGKLTEVPQATHGSPDRPLRIGDAQIPCFVLADGRRVLVQRHMIGALGMSLGGSSQGRDRLAKFVGQERLKDFVPKHLSSGTLSPIQFQTPQGNRALGYEASTLADICDAVLEARKKGTLTKKQQHIAAQCEILVRGFARVGIIALVDEATGYQADRARDALAKILEAFVAKELRRWVKTFPADFYKELFRLRGIPYTGSVKRPQYIGHLTNDLVYSRLAPGVLDELRRVTGRNEKGRLKSQLFRRLTEDIGHPRLLEHLAAVTTLMRACDAWDQFVPMLDRSLPRQVALPLFDGKEDGVIEITASSTPPMS